MNIIFSTPLCSACFADMMAIEQHRTALLNLLAGKMVAYESQRWKYTGFGIDHGPKTMPIVPPMEFRYILSLDTRDLESRDGGLYSKYFDWLLEKRPAGSDGYEIEGPWEREYNGGLYNSGTFEEPKWGSHT